MRSTTSSRRRLHSHPSPQRRIDAIAKLVDEGTVHDPGHVLVHIIEEPEDFLLGIKSLEIDVHPFNELAGFTAPAQWSMFGLRVRGTAHHLDGDRPSEPMSTTYLLGRSGEERSLLRTGDTVTELQGPASGTIPDLCRRVLGLPTDPAPSTTGWLWTVAWLDQILESWGDPSRRGLLSSSWEQLAVLHPAAAATPHHELRSLADPAQLIALGRAHSEAWPWARLRAEPGALHLPDGDLPVEITSWMDDGFYARWALGAFPPHTALAHDLGGLLGDELGHCLLSVLEGLLE